MSPNDPNLKVTRYELDHAGLYENNLIGDLMNYKDHERVVKYLTDKIAMLEFVDMRRLLDEEEIARNPMYQVRDDGKIERIPTAVRGHCQDCRHATERQSQMRSNYPLHFVCERGINDYDDGIEEDSAAIMEEPCAGHTQLFVGPLFGCVHFQPREG